MASQTNIHAIPWVEKYRPGVFEDFIGNSDLVQELENWLLTWNSQKKKVVLIAGPAGVGKTSVVYYLIKKYNYESVEVNASDKRNKAAVERLIGLSSTEGTVLQGARVRKIILVDEADGLFGNEDRGGGPALARAIDKAKIPIICTANDPSAKSLKAAKRKMKVITFKSLTEQEILLLLQKIVEKEKLDIDEKVLVAITKNSGGDARSAINDLQGVAFNTKDLEVIFSPRNQKHSLDMALTNIFSAKDYGEAKRALDGVDVDYRELLTYVYEHAWQQAATSIELFNIYELIAEADVYLSQCYIKQNWTFLKYFFILISSINLVKQSPFKYTKYSFPSYWALMGRLRGKTAKMKQLAEKSVKALHCSTRIFTKDIYPYLRIIFSTDATMAAGIAVWLQYNEDDVDFLTNGSSKMTRQIMTLYEEAYIQITESRLEKAKEIEIDLMFFANMNRSKKKTSSKIVQEDVQED
ncbi:MAG: replication factor C large subunit, partial [Candidatus Heimdallarchaeota archaeon]|nr:replication factor C large subunit [Candidatus Heimdallarchaeota archaeon]MCK4252953.1 replication factor C large subunit [Candidatus Heimdallarchaeota archaeon]